MRRASLVGGLSSEGRFACKDEPWSGGPGYMQEIDRAVGPLNDFLWALAARGAISILLLAAVLFALTYWLLGPPRRKA